MNEPKGNGCPECGALRAADNTPSCACTQRASDALRDTRTAEAAAAEDFDPLRIRPYVGLDGGGGTDEGEASVAEASATEVTMPLDPLTSVIPTPLVPPATEPSATDLSLFEAGDGGTQAPHRPTAHDRPRGHRRTVVLGLAGACVAVVAAAGYASGLFSYESPARDGALPEDVRAAVPDTSSSAAPTSPSEAGTTPPASEPPSSSPSPSTSPSPSASSTSPTPSRSAEPTQTATTVRATGSIDPDNGDTGRSSAPTVLRHGDKGPEVTELELRLTQLGLYPRAAGGKYNDGVEDAVTRYQQARGVQGDEPGVYGPATRSHLESETTAP